MIALARGVFEGGCYVFRLKQRIFLVTFEPAARNDLATNTLQH